MKLLGPVPMPSILEQTPWPTGFFAFPDASPTNEYFNCSIVRKDERNVLIVRRRNHGWNTLEAWYLKGMKPTKRFPIRIPATRSDEHWEDPRALVRNGTVIVSFCNFAGNTYAHQAITGLRPDWTAERPLRIKFGKNGDSLETNVGHEKNWTWFVHDDGRLWFVYGLADGRQVVCKTANGKVQTLLESVAPTWDYGEIRGGTSPVKFDGHYWTFMHSSTNWVKPKRRYHMGALRMEPHPPFRVNGISRAPILSGSERDPRQVNHPPCVFPCGAIHQPQTHDWLVTLGVNDCRCAWMRIPHRDLERSMYVC